MELKGTKTEKNLWEAFAGESQARNKYTFFSSVAKKEGYEQLAAIFEETAAISRQVMVSGMEPPFRALNHILACSFSLAAVSSKIAASCS